MVLRLVLAVFVIALVIGWMVLSGGVAYFSLDKRLTIAIDGVPVQGEVLGSGTSAIVTIREAGKKHSYQLFYEEDVDITGDMGFVADAGNGWRLVFLFCFKRAAIHPARE
jgi:hypothetical protein